MKLYVLLTISTLSLLAGCSSSSSGSSSTTTTTTGSTQPTGTSTYSGDFSTTLVLDRTNFNDITAGTYNLAGTTAASANFDTDKMTMQHKATGDGLTYTADYQDITISGTDFSGSTQGSFVPDGSTSGINTTVATSGTFNSDYTTLSGSSSVNLGINNSTISNTYSATKQ
jgi:ABC-type Fe3+-hydroxamate transport system substrate-binding protein